MRFDQYFRKDRPYLDGYKAIFVRSNTVANGLRGAQYDAEFRGRTPQERDQLVEILKDKVTVQEGPWVTAILLGFNVERKPFDDVGADPRVARDSIRGISRMRCPCYRSHHRAGSHVATVGIPLIADALTGRPYGESVAVSDVTRSTS